MKTAAQVIAEGLKASGTPFAAGIPGHGVWAVTDAFADPATAPPLIQVTHEQTAAHMADACFRLTGKPGVALASIGPGAANLLMGMATAYADSSAMLAVTGSAKTTMRGHGVMQSLDRKYAPDFPRLAEPVTKASFDVIAPDMAASVLHRALNALSAGRPGPVSIDLPLDVQVSPTAIEAGAFEERAPCGRPRPDGDALTRALSLMLEAERPCIVAGGGVLTAEASALLKSFADKVCAPVVFTWNGKGAIAEDHRLCAGPIGVGGSKAANAVAAEADVLLALGCRFSDWSSSSFRKGVTYAIPPTRLIHVDIDPAEIGRTYPVAIGLVADARKALEDLCAGVSPEQSAALQTRRAAYVEAVAARKKTWAESLWRRRRDHAPMSMLSVLAALRHALPREAVATVGSGHCQAAVRQGFAVYEPRTHITSGGYSTMGFAVPAAMASAIVAPERPVVAIVGDGDMLMSVHDLATCAMHQLPVICLVLNNQGFLSIRDGQDALFGRQSIAEFRRKTGGDADRYSPDFAALARSFGLDFAERAETREDIARLVRNALAHGGPALIEAPITQDAAIAGAEPSGWWDFPPGPRASAEILADYEAGLAAQQHLGADTSEATLVDPLGVYG